MNRVLEFIKEWFDVLILVDLIIFQVVLVCNLVQLKGMIEKRFDDFRDQLGSIFVSVANGEANTRGVRDLLTKIDKRLKKASGSKDEPNEDTLYRLVKMDDGRVWFKKDGE